MIRALRAAAAGAVGAVILAATMVAQAADVPASGVTALSVEGAWGSPLLGSGQSSSATGGTVSVQAAGETVTASAGETAVSLTARTGNPFGPGTFTVGGSAGASTVGLTAVTASGQCATPKGQVTVHEVTRTDGAITGFAATWTARCGAATVPNVGEIRWASTVDRVRFGPVTMGEVGPPQTITLTAPAQVSYQGAGWLGDSFAFVEQRNTCVGQQLETGQTCTLTVAARPGSRGGHAATVTPTATTSDGRIHTLGTVSLTTTGVETARGAYTGVRPARILDTRHAHGVTTSTPVGNGQTVPLKVAGVGGLPSTGVAAAVVNLTVVEPTARGYVTAYPSGSARPTASSVNFGAGWTGANLVTVAVGADGRILLHHVGGATHLVADVVGWYHSTATAPSTSGRYGSYVPWDPTRIADTRSESRPLAGGSTLRVGADFGSLNPHVRALAVTVTVTRATSRGYLTTWSGSGTRPGTSTLNYSGSRSVPNMAIVPVAPCSSACGSSTPIPGIAVSNTSMDRAHVIVDLVGFVDDNTSAEFAGRLRPITPARIADSRVRLGAPRLTSGAARPVALPAGHWNQWTMAMVANVTAVSPSDNTVLTVWDWDTDQPYVSNLNPWRQQTVANMTMSRVGGAGEVGVYNAGPGATDVLIDLAGTVELYSSPLTSGSTSTDGTARSAARETEPGRSTAGSLTSTARVHP